MNIHINKRTLILAILALLLSGSLTHAQPTGGRGPSPSDIDANPQAIGEAGVAWYTTWNTGLAEAKRSNRPIFFMSAATTCSGIPGVF